MAYAMKNTSNLKSSPQACRNFKSLLKSVTPRARSPFLDVHVDIVPLLSRRSSPAQKSGLSAQGGSDGALPLGDLINVGGALYGTTQYGGGSTGCSGGAGCGTVFKVTAKGVAFKGGSDGANPQDRLINVGGTLYGTTYGGGATGTGCAAGGCGTVFKVTPLAWISQSPSVYGAV
jgi:hypothetical protein